MGRRRSHVLEQMRKEGMRCTNEQVALCRCTDSSFHDQERRKSIRGEEPRVRQLGGVSGGLGSLTIKKRMDFMAIKVSSATQNSLTSIANEDRFSVSSN